MLIGFPKEFDSNETRIAILPQTVKKYVDLGINVTIEQGLGKNIAISDQEYINYGANVVETKTKLFATADAIVRLKKPGLTEINDFKTDSIYISFLDPFNIEGKDLITSFVKHNITSISMEMIPRITRAQKMDALSSQTNLAGYAAVILAAHTAPRVFPMLVTAAGTINPCKVFILGVGVAGLQAIATARRLGARVEAFDTRPETEEQVLSLGAKFVKINLGEVGQRKDGYAQTLTSEQINLQRAEMTKICARSEIIITTAQVFGRKAPILITEDMLKQMQPGTVVIDMAVASGGNVEGSTTGVTVTNNGVKIIGHSNLAGTVPLHASQLYANNIYHLIEQFWDKSSKTFTIDPADEIFSSCLLTHKGKNLRSN